MTKKPKQIYILIVSTLDNATVNAYPHKTPLGAIAYAKEVLNENYGPLNDETNALEIGLRMDNCFELGGIAFQLVVETLGD